MQHKSMGFITFRLNVFVRLRGFEPPRFPTGTKDCKTNFETSSKLCWRIAKIFAVFRLATLGH